MVNTVETSIYIDDVVNGIIKVLNYLPKSNESWDANNPDQARSKSPWRIFNIGNNKPQSLNKYIEVIEKVLKIKAKKDFYNCNQVIYWKLLQILRIFKMNLTLS